MIDKIKKLEEIEQQIIEIVDKSLGLKESIFIKHYIKEKDYNRVRAYMECCVLSSQTKVLDSILQSKYDEVYAERYKTVKTVDNLITYICQELI